jgi:hypothetical protein
MAHGEVINRQAIESRQFIGRGKTLASFFGPKLSAQARDSNAQAHALSSQSLLDHAGVLGLPST